MVDDDSVGSLAAGLPTAQLELPIVSGHTGIDERRGLKPLRREWTPELLGRHFLLSETDMAEAKRSRGAENILGFALTLLLIRFLGSGSIMVGGRDCSGAERAASKSRASDLTWRTRDSS